MDTQIILDEIENLRYEATELELTVDQVLDILIKIIVFEEYDNERDT